MVIRNKAVAIHAHCHPGLHFTALPNLWPLRIQHFTQRHCSPQQSPLSMPCVVHSMASPSLVYACPWTHCLEFRSGEGGGGAGLFAVPCICSSAWLATTFLDLLDNVHSESGICWGFKCAPHCEAGSVHRAASSSARTQMWKV